MLLYAIISMLAAVTFYTTGVILEKRSSHLSTKHIIIFWFGLLFDTIGTTIMGKITEGVSFSLHSFLGAFALILMLLHVIWATYLNFKGTQHQKQNFHKYSIVVWLIWLLPFFGGIFMGMH